MSKPLRMVSSHSRDILRVFQREVDGGRKSGCGARERALILLPMEECVATSCFKISLWISTPYQLSAPYLVHHLRGNLAGLEASVASLESVEAERGGSNCVFSFPYIPYLAFEGEGIGSLSVQ